MYHQHIHQHGCKPHKKSEDRGDKGDDRTPPSFVDAECHRKRESGVDNKVGAMTSPEVVRRGGSVAPIASPGADQAALDNDEDHVNDEDEGSERRDVEVVFLGAVPAGVARIPPCRVGHCMFGVSV